MSNSAAMELFVPPATNKVITLAVKRSRFISAFVLCVFGLRPCVLNLGFLGLAGGISTEGSVGPGAGASKS